MKTKLTLHYDKCSIEDKFIIFRIIHEIYAEKPAFIDMPFSTVNINKTANLSANIHIYNKSLYEKSHEFCKFVLLRLRQIKGLVKGVNIKITRDFGNEITVDYCQKVVCSYFNIPVEMLQSNTRKREIVQVRQIAMFLSKKLTKYSLAAIGSEIGNKDHATVLHACRTVNNLIETDKQYRAQVEEIEIKLKGK